MDGGHDDGRFSTLSPPSIFLALGLAEEKQVNKRVSAVLLFLRGV